MKHTKRVKIKNDLGLHTRPATVIVKLLQAYESHVSFTYRREKINARSIMGILMLAARKNCFVTITAEGVDAEDVIEELTKAFDNKFGEDR